MTAPGPVVAFGTLLGAVTPLTNGATWTQIYATTAGRGGTERLAVSAPANGAMF